MNNDMIRTSCREVETTRMPTASGLLRTVGLFRNDRPAAQDKVDKEMIEAVSKA